MQPIIEGRIPEVVIAGIEDPVNQFTRAIQSYGFKAIHIPDARKNIPVADAAICVTSHMGHGLYDQVKTEFKRHNKRCWALDRGFTEIKNEFEDYFFGPIRQQLEPAPWVIRFTYLLGYIIRDPGKTFTFQHFLSRIKPFYSDIEEHKYRVNNFVAEARKLGTIEKVEGKKGVYIFKGLTDQQADTLKGHGFIIPEQWTKTWLEEKERKKEQEREERKKASQQLVEPKPEPKPLSNDENYQLLLDEVSSLSKEVTNLRGKIVRQNERMTQMLQIVNPNGRQDLVAGIHNKLDQMNQEQLLRLNAMIDLLFSQKI